MTDAIRPAQVADLDAVVQNLWDVAAEGRWLGTETPFDRDDRRDRFVALLERDTAALLVADRGPHGVVGHLSVDLAPYGVATIGMLVADGQRGRGVGTALLAAGRDWAIPAGAHKLALEVWPDNVPAIALYERFGFVREGRRVRHYRRRDGGLWDSLLMGLPL